MLGRINHLSGFIAGNRPAHVLLLIALGAFGVWAYLTFGGEDESTWHCDPIDPSSDSLPDNPCFRATWSQHNLVTLEWRLINAAPQIYIYDNLGPHFEDVGELPAYCEAGRGGSCKHSFRVSRGGLYRWSLEARSRWPGQEEQRLYAPASLRVPPPYPLRIDTYDPFVDVLAPGQRSVTWEVDSRSRAGPSGWVEIRSTALGKEVLRLPRSGAGANLQVSAQVLARQGTTVYELSDCHLPPGSKVKFCSEPVNAGFYTGADHFKGDHLRRIDIGQDLEVNFSARSGHVRKLDLYSPGTGGSARHLGLTDGGSLVLKAESLSEGVHRLTLTSCLDCGRQCANTLGQVSAERAGLVFQMPERFYFKDDAIGLFFPRDGSPGRVLRAPAHGVVEFADQGIYRRVEEGEPIAVVYGAPSDQMYIHAGAGVSWDIGRDYREDFAAGVAHPVHGPGGPLDVTYDSSGNLWLLNEFSNSVEQVSAAGHVETLDLPLAREERPGFPGLQPVRPFAINVGAVIGRTNVTSLAERITPVGDAVWFTQGGGMMADYAQAHNHSRILMFDRHKRDLATTLHDDRFCVYNVPADDPGGYGNNQVIGLAASGGRIWFAESRGIFDVRPSVISSFIPDTRHCNALLDFEDPNALAAQSLQYCTEYTNPEQDGCIQRVVLDGVAAGIKAAHLETDPVDGSLWFTDAHGRYLGNIDPARGGALTVHRIPDDHSEAFVGMYYFGGFPWSIKADDEAVYFSEYATHHILRFDKSTRTFSEIHVPCTSPQVRLHSIDIDHRRRRLWFTLTNEQRVPLEPAASTIGYVDLDQWRDHSAGELAISEVHGVIYSGLDGIALPGQHAGQPYAFRGIDVNPQTGAVALATMLRPAITELTPRPGFWP